MSLATKLRSIAERIEQLGDTVGTEEATKHAFVLPFLAALGHDVFDPTQVVPEYVADIGTKRGEKIDYMVMINGQPTIMIECKPLGATLTDAHNTQLFRYFASTPTRIAAITDGDRYDFYSDLDSPNVMDSRPFLRMAMTSLTERSLSTLEKLSRPNFDLDSVLVTAAYLKRTNAVKSVLADEMESPSDEFVRLLAGKIYDGRLTKAALEELQDPIRAALKSFIQDQVNQRLRNALMPVNSEPVASPEPTDQEEDSDIVTTAEEIEGFYAVKSCVRETIDPRRVTLRDSKSYCAILIDDNNRKSLCRLWFNGSRKYLGIFDASKKETRFEVSDVDDIFRYAEELRARVRLLDGGRSNEGHAIQADE